MNTNAFAPLQIHHDSSWPLCCAHLAPRRLMDLLKKFPWTATPGWDFLLFRMDLADWIRVKRPRTAGILAMAGVWNCH